jgi:hypothetical protein
MTSRSTGGITPDPRGEKQAMNVDGEDGEQIHGRSQRTPENARETTSSDEFILFHVASREENRTEMDI